MLGFLGWLAFSALLFVFFFYKRIVDQQKEHALSRELVLAANGSLQLSEVLNSALDGVLSLLDMDAGAIHLLNEKENTMVQHVQKGFPEEFAEELAVISLDVPDCLISHVVARGEGIFLSDIHKEKGSRFLQCAMDAGVKSAACIPIFIQEKLIGTLLVNKQRRFRFHSDNITMLNNLGHALGQAVEKARLYEQASRDRQQMSVINEITKIINSSLDFPEIFGHFSKRIREVIHFDRCLILLLTDQGKSARIFLLDTPYKTDLPVGLAVPAENTSAGWILKHKKPHFAFDLKEDRQFWEDEMLLGEGMRSAVRVPICSQNETIGVFVLNSKEPNRYSEKNLEILEPVAEHLALALDKYLLFHRVSELSLTDELTGCGNRRMLAREMEREIKRADRYGRSLGLIILDIDHFKMVNDSYGHLTGDSIIRKLGRLVQEQIREIDSCIRYGGEEFVVLLPETDPAGALSVAEKLRSAVIGTPFVVKGATHWVTISLGVAVYPQHAADGDELIQHADDALYGAKKAGRNRTIVYESVRNIKG